MSQVDYLIRFLKGYLNMIPEEYRERIRIRLVQPDETRGLTNFDRYLPFRHLGLYLLCMVYGEVKFKTKNGTANSYYVMAIDRKRQGQIDENIIYYSKEQYSSLVRELFTQNSYIEHYRLNSTKTGLITNGEFNTATDQNFLVNIPQSLGTDVENHVIRNLIIIGDLLPGINHEKLYSQRINSSVRVQQVVEFLESLEFTRPAIVVGIRSTNTLESVQVNQESSSYYDSVSGNSPDYHFMTRNMKTLKEIGALLNGCTVELLKIENIFVGLLVEYNHGSNRLLLNEQNQIVQNPESFNTEIHRGVLKCNDKLVVKPFNRVDFNYTVPQALIDWVEQQYLLYMDAIGVLRKGKHIFKEGISYRDALKYLSLKHFKSDEIEQSRFINTTLVENFDGVKHRIGMTEPVIDPNNIPHAAWNIFQAFVQKTIQKQDTDVCVHLLNQAEFKYNLDSSQTHVLNVLIYSS